MVKLTSRDLASARIIRIVSVLSRKDRKKTTMLYLSRKRKRLSGVGRRKDPIAQGLRRRADIGGPTDGSNYGDVPRAGL